MEFVYHHKTFRIVTSAIRYMFVLSVVLAIFTLSLLILM